MILVSFSFVLADDSSQNDSGTNLRKFSKALLISRIRVRSRAFAVFRRYLLRGAAFGLDLFFVAATVTGAGVIKATSISVVWPVFGAEELILRAAW